MRSTRHYAQYPFSVKPKINISVAAYAVIIPLHEEEM